MNSLFPTLNRSYNKALQQWSIAGFHSPPCCEECDKDLTNKRVIETEINWLCVECAIEEGYEVEPDLQPMIVNGVNWSEIG